jgi:ribosomal protein S4
LDGLVLFLGFSSTRFMAQELVRCGCIRINGVVNTNINTSLNINDIVQFDLSLKKNLKKLYKLNHWLCTKARLKYINFMHIS